MNIKRIGLIGGSVNKGSSNTTSTDVSSIKTITDRIEVPFYTTKQGLFPKPEEGFVNIDLTYGINIVNDLYGINISPKKLVLGSDNIVIERDYGIKLGSDATAVSISNLGIFIGTGEYGINIQPGFNSEKINSGSGSGYFTEDYYGGLQCANKNIYLGTNTEIGFNTNVVIGKHTAEIDISTNGEYLYIGSDVYISRHYGICIGTSNDIDICIGRNVILSPNIQLEIEKINNAGNDVVYLIIKDAYNKRYTKIKLDTIY